MEATENQTVCGQCDYECKSLDDLVKHVKVTPNHTPRCVPCNVKYKTFPIFRKHLKMFHFKTVSEYVCADCGKVSHTEEANLKHYNHNHRREADMYCNLCAKDMLNMERLRKHTKICMLKEPELIEKLRRDNEDKNPAVKDLIQVWSFDHFVAWQKECIAKIQEKELAKLKKTSHVKRKSESPIKKLKKIKKDPDKIEEPDVESKPNLSELPEGKVFNKEADESKDELKESKDKSGNDSESDNDSEHDFVAGFNNTSFPNEISEDDEEIENVKVEVQVKEEIPSDVDHDDDHHSDSSSESDSEESPVKPEGVKEESKMILFERKEKDQTNTIKSEGKHRPCPECGKDFESYSGMRKHLRKVHPELFPDEPKEPTVCLECGKTVKHLLSHMKAVHSAEDPVYCTECGKEFRSKYHLSKHVNAVHEGGSGSKKEKQLSPCPLCGKEVKYLKEHLEVHERQENGSPRKVPEEKMCPVCGKSVKHLKTHIDNVHAFQGGKGGEFPCEECGSVYKTKEYLQNHIRCVHRIATSVDTQVICDVCSKGFKNNIALNSHKKRQHGEKGFFPCKTCNIVFDAKHKLYVHDYNVHRMEEMHCEICGATCKNKKQMYDHMRKIHPGGQMRVKHKKEIMSPPFHIPQY